MIINTNSEAVELCVTQYITGYKMDQPIDQVVIALLDERNALRDRLGTSLYPTCIHLTDEMRRNCPVCGNL